MLNVNYLAKIIANTPLKSNEVFELEVKFKPKLIEYQRLKEFLKLHDIPFTVEDSTVNYYGDIREIITQNKSSYEIKTRLKHDITVYGFSITLSTETKVVSKPLGSPTSTRHRLRYSYAWQKDYRIDMTEVLDNKGKHNEVELEYIGEPKYLDLQDLQLQILRVYQILYESQLFAVINDIRHVVDNVNKLFGSSSYSTIDKNIFVKARNLKFQDLTNGAIVNHPQLSYYVSHKADGLRHFLILSPKGVWLISTTHNNFLINKSFNNYIVLECEVVNHLILVYDCLIYNNKDIRNVKYARRLEHVNEALVLLKNTEMYQFQAKIPTLLTLDNFFITMKKLFDEQETLNYPQDGFIFTPSGRYDYGTADSNIPLADRKLRNYPDVCKWKPSHRITIDFRVIKDKDDKISLLVYNGKKEVPFKIYNYIIDDKFSDSMYLNQIVETQVDPLCHMLKPIKIRADKSGPNMLDIAMANWQDIQDPITRDDLIGTSIELVKKYHNQVKNMLYNIKTIYPPIEGLKFPDGYRLLDIGSGRGGDIKKWQNSKANQVFVIEPNDDNLQELYRRLDKTIFKDNVITIPTQGENVEEITSVVTQYGGSVDVVSMMLSLSFFYASDKHLDSLVETITRNLKKGGKFIFLSINGSALQAYFEKQKVVRFNEVTFKLVDDHFVRVSIPGIVGHQWEFMVDLSRLTNKLEKKGFVLKLQRPATDELLLSHENKLYTELFTYGYYEKVRDARIGKPIQLPDIVYPDIPLQVLTPIKIDATRRLDSVMGQMVRIGTPKKDSDIHAVLNAVDRKYQKNNDKKFRKNRIKLLRKGLLRSLSEEVWLHWRHQSFPKRLVVQLQGKAMKIEDYSYIGIKYHMAHGALDLLLEYIADFFEININVFTYGEDLELLMSTYSCDNNDNFIWLLKIDEHYELLGEKEGEYIKTLFYPTDRIQKLIEKPLMEKIDVWKDIYNKTLEEVISTLPVEWSQLSPEDPLYLYIHKDKKEQIELYVNALIKTIKKNYKIPNDTQLIRAIESLFDSKNPTKDFQKILKSYRSIVSITGRAEERVKTFVDLVGDFKFKTVLDIGAGKGDIITAIQQYYKLPKNQVYAIDQKLPNIKGITALTYDAEGNIPLEDQSIDIIILFAVLHHIPTEPRLHLMYEMKRVLSSKGLVIIREHDDNKDPVFLKFIELIHIFWYIKEHEHEDPLNLMSYEELLVLFQSVGFESIKHTLYMGPNPQRIYHEVFEVKGEKFRKFDENVLKQQSYFNYQCIATTAESRYSSLMPWHQQQVSDWLAYELEELEFNLWIDATAHIGCDTFLIRKLYPQLDIIAIEKNESTFNILKANLENLSNIIGDDIVKPIRAVHDDAVAYLQDANLGDVVVFVDPPWGGIKYKEEEKINLYLDKISIGELVNRWLIKDNSPTMIILKTPENFDFELFYEELQVGIDESLYVETHPVKKTKEEEVAFYLVFVRYMTNK